MHMTYLKIKNLYGIREFETDGKDLELTGKNGVNKSSIIDAIRIALTNKSPREYSVYNGETEGEVSIKTDTGLLIQRKFRTNKADYKSIRQEGSKTELNEGFIRELFTPLQLDPFAFTKLDEQEQNRIILDLIDFKWDLNWINNQFGEIPSKVNYQQNILKVLHDIQADNGAYFLKREEINRDRRNKQAFVEEIGSTLPERYNASHWQEIDLGVLYTKIEGIRAKNKAIEDSKILIEVTKGKKQTGKVWFTNEKNKLNAEEEKAFGENQKAIDELKHQIELLQAKKNEIGATYTQKHETIKAKYNEGMKALDAIIEKENPHTKEELEDCEPLVEEAKEAETMKGHVNEYNRMIGLQAEIKQMDQVSAELTAKIERARELPGQILEKCIIPIEGLTIKEGIPLINGLPVSNLSEGEKFDLCVDITSNKNNALQMILLDGIECLAKEKREALYKKLKSKGVQFIAARTSDEETLQVTEI